MTKQNTTDFGYTQVPLAEKVEKVRGVFDAVAGKYDLMNDVMSFGIHRLWKRFAVDCAKVRAGEQVLDVAGGTGDLSLAFAKAGARVFMLDINAQMLAVGRGRLLDQGQSVTIIQGNAEALPFTQHYFDCVTISFGLRNVTDKQQALNAMFRVLKPGGRILILEFSKPVSQVVSQLYDTYSFAVLPRFGAEYQYLAESIRMHPDQETLKNMLNQAGFEATQYYNLSGGIVAVHKAYKY